MTKKIFLIPLLLSLLSTTLLAYADGNYYIGLSPITGKGDFKVFIGEKTSEFLSGDLQYIDFGELAKDQDTVKARSLGYALLFKKSISKKAQVFAKLGLHKWEADLKTTGNSFSSSGTDLFWGIGANFHVANDWFLRIEHERFKFELEPTGHINVNLNSASLIKKF